MSFWRAEATGQITNLKGGVRDIKRQTVKETAATGPYPDSRIRALSGGFALHLYREQKTRYRLICFAVSDSLRGSGNGYFCVQPIAGEQTFLTLTIQAGDKEQEIGLLVKGTDWGWFFRRVQAEGEKSEFETLSGKLRSHLEC